MLTSPFQGCSIKCMYVLVFKEKDWIDTVVSTVNSLLMEDLVSRQFYF